MGTGPILRTDSGPKNSNNIMLGIRVILRTGSINQNASPRRSRARPRVFLSGPCRCFGWTEKRFSTIYWRSARSENTDFLLGAFFFLFKENNVFYSLYTVINALHNKWIG